MSQADYELCDSFHIDDGELDGLSPQQCFVLGVEWQMFAKELETGREFNRQIHTENMDRFEKLLKAKGREGQILSRTDDWIHLRVWRMD